MLTTLPILWGAFTALPRWRLAALVSGIAAIMGLFINGSRTPVVIFFLSIAGFLVWPRLETKFRFVLLSLIAIGCVSAVALFGENERLQRFKTLNDASMVRDRVRLSFSTSITDMVFEYLLVRVVLVIDVLKLRRTLSRTIEASFNVLKR